MPGFFWGYLIADIMGIMLLLVAASGISWSQSLGSRQPIPDAGLSEEQIDALGPEADSAMLARLDDSREMGHRKGLLFRLRLNGNLKKPNTKIANRLMRFVDEQSTCEGTVSAEQIFDIGSALEAIGQRGDSEAVEYLTKWITLDEKSAQMRCFDGDAAADDFRDLLRRNAVIGLGLNGTKIALQRLNEIKSTPPKVKYPGSLMSVIDRAIGENQKIQKIGIEKYFQHDIEQLKKHRVRSRKKIR